ncbi:pilus assembly protein [Chania multitudinisentens RB-25]|uniref:Pilus assembly protein n=1 Tax=Chania multitudinisentens RB-25 TaxID=1441930 RepID=W0L6Z5_9GAMM|nr:PilN family type IVB pilus formation outer membrane protein [Chania multitudinisentens]AHG19496.1 pilus assembly protein [Chania multitudinisentens RB-25]
MPISHQDSPTRPRSGWVISLLALSVLSGCSLTTINEREQETQQTGAQAERLVKDMKHPRPAAVNWVDTPWINPKPITTARRPAVQDLPPCSLTLTINALSLHEFGQRVSTLCGLPVTITADAASTAEGLGARTVTQPVSGAIPAPDDHGRVPLAMMGGVTSVAPPVSASATINTLRWQGELGGLLDTVTSQLGLSWRVEAGRIVIYSLETRTFQLAVLNVRSSMRANVLSGTSASTGAEGGSASNSLSGEASTSQTTSVEQASDLYDDIKKTVETMLTPSRGRFFLSAASGTLTVTDTPSVLARVAEYIEHENAVLNKQVLLNVEVLSVSTSRSDQMGIDWSVVYASLGGVGASLTGAFSNASGNALSSGVSILDSATGSRGRFSGSSLLVKALSEQGNVAVVTSHSSATTNLTPVPVQIAEQTVYVARTSINTTANVGSSTTMEPGTITTGFNMTMLPFIQDSGDIQLQFSFNLSDSPTIRSIASTDGSTAMEMPYTKLRSLSQRVNLRDGQTLVLTGFEQTNTTVNKEGTFTPGNFLFGGGRDADKKRTTLVVLITPVLM